MIFPPPFLHIVASIPGIHCNACEALIRDESSERTRAKVSSASSVILSPDALQSSFPPMKHFSVALLGFLAPLFLAACATVDIAGISPQSNKGPNPDSNAGAAVVVMEFGDLQCPACRTAEFQIVQPLLKELGSKIRYEFKQFPLLNIHRYTMAAAEASECAADQGNFWPFLEMAYEKQADLNADAPRLWAQQLGLNMNLFDRCTQSHIKRQAILSEFAEGRKFGVGGTPTFFVNGEPVENDLNSLRAAITAAEGGDR